MSADRGRVAEIELGGPADLIAEALGPLRAEVEGDPDVWAVLVRMSGGDPVAGQVGGAAAPSTTPWSKPMILAVTDSVSGLGFDLALAADVLLATPETSFLLPSPRSAAESREALGRCFGQLPYRVVTALAMSGRPLGGARAHELGFVTEAVPAAELGAAARTWADSIAAVPPGAAAAIREAARGGLEKDLASAIEGRYRAVERYAESDDAAEAVRALVEARRPLWRGH